MTLSTSSLGSQLNFISYKSALFSECLMSSFSYYYKFKLNENVEPTPNSDDIATLPPNYSIICLEISKPSPIPEELRFLSSLR